LNRFEQLSTAGVYPSSSHGRRVPVAVAELERWLQTSAVKTLDR
jgi:hypothetical protein